MCLAVGKSASRAIGNLVKVDGQISRAYGSKELKSRQTREDVRQSPVSNREKPERQKSLHGYTRANTKRGDGGGGGGTGLSGQMSKNMAVSIEYNTHVVKEESDLAVIILHCGALVILTLLW